MSVCNIQCYSKCFRWIKLSCFSCVQLSATPSTVTRQAPLFMGFSRQEYWSRLPCPRPRDLPDTGIEPGSPALQAVSLPLIQRGSPRELAPVIHLAPAKSISSLNSHNRQDSFCCSPALTRYMVRKQRSLVWVQPTESPLTVHWLQGASSHPGLGRVESTPQRGAAVLAAKVPVHRGKSWCPEVSKEPNRQSPDVIPAMSLWCHTATSVFQSPPPGVLAFQGYGASVGLVTRTQGNNPSWAIRELTVIQPPTCLLLVLHLLWRPEAGREMLAVWCRAECRQGREGELRMQVSSSQVRPSQLLEFFPSWYMPFCSGNPAPSLLKCGFSSSLYTCVCARAHTHTHTHEFVVHIIPETRGELLIIF